MTEAEWMACTQSSHLKGYIQEKASDRKWRLAACACVRRYWRWMGDARARDAVEAAERFADGEADLEQLHTAGRNVNRALEELLAPGRNVRLALKGDDPSFKMIHAASRVASPHRCDMRMAMGAAWSAAPYGALCESVAAGRTRIRGDPREAESAAQCVILRDVFGNPFRPVPVLSPSWLAWNDGAIRKMAQAIYDARAFDRLPLLADALEEAGCADADILAHCRSGGEHVRGCWVVDLLLGKE